MGNINRELIKFNYNVYGLKVESEIEIKEFIKSDNKNNDIKFMLGNMPDKIMELRKNGQNSYYSKSDIWFYVKDIGNYYIANGNIVIIEPDENADVRLLTLFLMCSCLGLIMLQRDQVAIHGGTIVIDGKGVILTGDRGAGKSTLTTALRLKGYPFISDDVAATYIDRIPFIYPGFPYQKLCEDAMDKLGYDKSRYTSYFADDKVKYIVQAQENFIDYNIQLNTMFELVTDDVNEVTIDEITGGEKLAKIIKNIYRIEYIELIGGMTGEYFKKVLNIAKNIKFYKITRPKEGFTVDKQIKLIEQTLNNYKAYKVV